MAAQVGANAREGSTGKGGSITINADWKGGNWRGKQRRKWERTFQ